MIDEFELRLTKLKPKPGDIILVRANDPWLVRRQLQESPLLRKLKDVEVWVCGAGFDVEQLDADRLRELGWQKIS